jgi:hypothetical protein
MGRLEQIMVTRTVRTDAIARWLRWYWKPAILSLGFWVVYTYACVSWIGH